MTYFKEGPNKAMTVSAIRIIANIQFSFSLILLCTKKFKFTVYRKKMIFFAPWCPCFETNKSFTDEKASHVQNLPECEIQMSAPNLRSTKSFATTVAKICHMGRILAIVVHCEHSKFVNNNIIINLMNQGGIAAD